MVENHWWRDAAKWKMRKLHVVYRIWDIMQIKKRVQFNECLDPSPPRPRPRPAAMNTCLQAVDVSSSRAGVVGSV